MRDVLLGANEAQEVQKLGLLFQLQAVHVVHDERREPAMQADDLRRGSRISVVFTLTCALAPRGRSQHLFFMISRGSVRHSYVITFKQ